MQQLDVANVVEGKSAPLFTDTVEMEWYTINEDDSNVAIEARAKDMTFIVQRQNKDIRASWSSFNQRLSNANQEVTTVGYMPIIQAPAHDMDTLNTVVRRCMYVTSQLGQHYTVLIVDQALYYKLIDLKWSIPEYRDKFIPRLGGHISMNFLKVVGQHMKDSGLCEAWVDAGILGHGTAEHVMRGKDYNKGMRTHKLTFQALWRTLLPVLTDYIRSKDLSLTVKLNSLSVDERTDELIELLKSSE